MYGVATDKDRLHSRGGGLRGGVKTTGTIDSSATVPLSFRCVSGGDLRSVCLPPNTMI